MAHRRPDAADPHPRVAGGAGLPDVVTSLQRFVARRNWRRRSKATVRMEDTAPGEVAEVDFGRLGLVHDPETGRHRAVWALLLVLGHSRHCFLWPSYGQTLEDVIAGLESAWTFFVGIPEYLVIDNCPPAVAAADPLHPGFTRGFLEYSQHRGFIADGARARHPKDKPKVERGAPCARERFFPGAPSRAGSSGTWPTSVSRQSAGAAVWPACASTAPRDASPCWSSRTRSVRRCFPGTASPARPPTGARPRRTGDHHIQCRSALYSVPSGQCPPGRKAEVRVDSKLVRIYYQGRLIKTRLRQPKGGRATGPGDYPTELSPYTTGAPDGIKSKAAGLGPAVAEFAQRLFDGPLPWAKVRQGRKLLRLGQRYTPERLDAAGRRALDVDLIDARRVESILVQALEQETTPQLPAPPATGRFARPGSVFAQSGHYRRTA